MDEQKKIIKEYFETAPEEIRLVIKKIVNHPELINSIALKGSVDNSKVSLLSTLVISTLLGTDGISKFRQNLIQELGITYDQALKISLEANTTIFGSVMGTLKQAEIDIKKYDENEEREKSELTKSEPLTESIPEKEKLLMDHETMTHVDGPHIHSQNVMPSMTPTAPVRTSLFAKMNAPISFSSKPATTPSGIPNQIASTPASTPTPSVPTSTHPTKPEPFQFTPKKPEIAPEPIQTTPPPKVFTAPKPVFKSIVDQKLSGIVRSANISASTSQKSPTTLPTGEKDLEDMMSKPSTSGASPTANKYTGQDPYREPIE